MKTIQTILVLAALAITAAAQLKSESAVEQRFFNLEDAVKHREELSDVELAALSNDDLMRKELGQHPLESKLTQDGLEVAVVHLCNTRERDVVVIGDGAQYAGANVGPFWIIRDLPAGPVVVLSEISLSLSIGVKRTNKCLNVEAFAATAVEGTTTDFSFNGEKYTVSRQKMGKLR